MQTTESIWFNGKMVPWDEAKVHVLTHSLHYGGGAFEGIRFYKTPKGTAIFKLKEHIKRLLYSAGALKMSLPYSQKDIEAAAIEVVRINKLEEGYIRPIIFFGYGKMGVNPVGSPVDIAIACWPWGAYLPHDAVDIKTSEFIRIHPDSTIVDAKLTGHYLNGILASLAIQGTHYHEVLFLDSEDFISEGGGENFFIVKDGVLYTPQLGTILAGITRETIMQLAQDMGIKVVQKNITLDEAYAADEAFFTGTAAEVTAIRSIDDKAIGAVQPGSVTTRIKTAYMDLVHGGNPKYAESLTYVK
ncbi:MAG TPA: branched-chain amino acid transaminase [Gammaproteobacteria bacterium]|nr:branched-chain amino acid transaminase [Gammaproteobacteria bacterium]